MTDPSRVHYFRDLHIKGINWRPTHFVDEVPVSRLCALCLTIPRRTMLLPCAHFLCEKCFAFKSHDGFGLCPLDETFFEEAECDSYDLPITTAKAFQVYCWNKDHGCDFKGALKDMLQHCRNDCTFRSCDNLQCGEAVVNEKIGTRQVAECSTTVSSACTESMSSDCGALTLQDVRNALNEVETSLMKPNQDKVPPATECRMSELTEQAGNQESRLVEAAGEVGSSVAAETAQPAATPSPTVSQETASRLNPAEEASVSQSSASCSQKMPRKEEPEIFSIISRNLLTRMQKTSTEDFPQHCIDSVNPPRGACRLTLTKPLSTTRTWKVLGTATYVITFENCPFLLTESGRPLCTVTVLHTKDSSFTLWVRSTFHSLLGHGLIGTIDFVGAVLGARCLLPSFDVSLHNEEREETIQRSYKTPAVICDDAGVTRLNFQCVFEIPAADLRRAGCYSNERVGLQIVLKQEDNTHDAPLSC